VPDVNCKILCPGGCLLRFGGRRNGSGKAIVEETLFCSPTSSFAVGVSKSENPSIAEEDDETDARAEILAAVAVTDDIRVEITASQLITNK
jgi:hypothetical protein